jgi:hypothetical protein
VGDTHVHVLLVGDTHVHVLLVGDTHVHVHLGTSYQILVKVKPSGIVSQFRIKPWGAWV